MYPPSLRSIPWMVCQAMRTNHKSVMDKWTDRWMDQPMTPILCPPPTLGTTKPPRCQHDDVIKWKHILRYWPSVWNSPVTGEFPSQRPVTQSFDIFFDLRLNKQLSKQSWDWWFESHGTDYDVIVMNTLWLTSIRQLSDQIQHFHLYSMSNWYQSKGLCFLGRIKILSSWLATGHQ